MIKIKFFKITDSPQLTYENLQNYIPITVQNKLLNYRVKEDKIRSVVGRIILKNLLIDEGYPKDVLDLVRPDKYQRPFIDDKIDFNISHSGDYVVCAISKNNRVGIDIEKIKPLNIQDFEIILTREEKNILATHVQPLEYFYSIWTQKEAVMKANGRGLAIAFTDVLINNNIAICENTKWELLKLNIAKDYESHIAFELGDSEITIDELKAEDLSDLDKKY